MTDQAVGKVVHYFEKISVAIVELSGTLEMEDAICIRGSSTDFNQTVSSMQREHQPIKMGKPGEVVGIKVEGKVKEGDIVYKA